MSVLCPTVMTLSDDPHEFRGMMERIGSLGSRVQIDLMDGDFAPHRNLDPARIWWPAGVKADIHFMYKHPKHYLDMLLKLEPHMIIIHAEAADDVHDCLMTIQAAGVHAGVALLEATDPSDVKSLVRQADHVLLFAGKLGESGEADMAVLEKIPFVRQLNPTLEIGWDGGANESNIADLAAAGVNVINLGGVLRNAEDPSGEFMRLNDLIS